MKKVKTDLKLPLEIKERLIEIGGGPRSIGKAIMLLLESYDGAGRAEAISREEKRAEANRQLAELENKRREILSGFDGFAIA